nr:hypothetical protein [Tanacetum cinerariifolium]
MARSRIQSCSATIVNVGGICFRGTLLADIRGLAAGWSRLNWSSGKKSFQAKMAMALSYRSDGSAESFFKATLAMFSLLETIYQDQFSEVRMEPCFHTCTVITEHISNLEDNCLEFKQELLDLKAEVGYTINLSDEEIILDEQARSGSRDSE